MGTAYAYGSEAHRAAPLTLEEFSDEHGTPAQRAYNVVCIACGADPKLFGDIVSKGYLLQKRAEGCGDEYEQIAEAFDTLIAPISTVPMRRESWTEPGCPNQPNGWTAGPVHPGRLRRSNDSRRIR